MKINPLYNRSILDPTAGVKFTKQETGAAIELGRVLAELPDDVQAQIRRAMAYEARRVLAAIEWTGDEQEVERVAQYERALVTLYALDHARTGFQI